MTDVWIPKWLTREGVERDFIDQDAYVPSALYEECELDGENNERDIYKY